MSNSKTGKSAFAQKWQSLRHRPGSLAWYILVHAGALFSVATLAFIVVYILINGIPNLTPELFSIHYDSENVSMLPALINTLFMAVIALVLALPIGIGAAIYLVEYAKKGSRFVGLVRLTAETLTGIPSIIYGLFGSIFFVKFCNMGLSLLSGALTLAIMVLPVILRTTEESLKMVPDSYREGSFGLGAGKLRTISQVVLPSAIPGIVSGVILSIGRIVGESAALIFTAGTIAEVASSVFASSRTLAVHMYVLSGEGLYMNQTFATAVVLLLLAIILNFAAEFVAKLLRKDQ
ncbi:MAG: phosphate ABC transporter permease PstA [Peptococcaceae bacterium]|nr:phosphate ABC transporter permease PstA [Peptococcaceae bacterium]